MQTFESAKRYFDGSDDTFEIYSIAMTVPTSQYFDPDNLTVMLPR